MVGEPGWKCGIAALVVLWAACADGATDPMRGRDGAVPDDAPIDITPMDTGPARDAPVTRVDAPAVDGCAGGERCNGVDDDCDSMFDEGFNVGATCDGPDSDLCEEGHIGCTPDAMGTTCDDATGDSPPTVHVDPADPRGSCSMSASLAATIETCGCPSVRIAAAFADMTDASAGQVVSSSSDSSCMHLTWDDCPAGCDCDLDISNTVCWTVSMMGTTLVVGVTNTIDGLGAINLLGAGYDITGSGAQLLTTGTDTRSFSFDCSAR